MHIILGEPNVRYLEDRYLLLPLDQFKLQESSDAVQSYCVLDKDTLDIEDVPKLDELVNLHIKCMENYQKKNWNFCNQAIEHLRGKFRGSVDSFYDEISQRIAKYIEEDPGEDWDYIIHKY